MKLKTKTRLANISVWVIVITIIIITLFFFGFLISSTYDLKVFTGRTSNFMWTLFAASLVIVICGAFLNISLNIGLIADSRQSKIVDKQAEASNFNKRFIIALILILATIVGYLFLGDFITRQAEKKNLITESEEILTRYDKSVDDITKALSDTSMIGEIPEILNFLRSQKQEFPSITLIASDYHKEQLTYLHITPYTDAEDLTKELFNSSFYACNKNDCNYLKSVFEDGVSDFYFWSEKSNYKLYYPIVEGEKKYILLFSKFDRYGNVDIKK